jgi:hypothetical protein
METSIVTMNAEAAAFRRAAADHACAIRALYVTVEAAERYPELAGALAVLEENSDDMCVSLPALRFEIREREQAVAGLERMALLVERLGEASALCACGHRGTQHAQQTTEDERVPCAIGVCPCDDAAAPS